MIPVGAPPKGLHIHFPSELGEAVRAEAARRGLHPATLVAATMTMSLADNMLDAIFDGQDPLEIAAPYGRRADGLTYCDCAVLYLAATHADDDGACRLQLKGFARRIKGATVERVASVITKLVKRELLERQGRGPSSLQLTKAGEAIARQLLGGRDG